MGEYDVMQVCLGGHIINHSTTREPQHNKEFCTSCGQKTITACPSCNEAIQGKYYEPFVNNIVSEFPPSYCHKCGNPYPWHKKSSSL